MKIFIIFCFLFSVTACHKTHSIAPLPQAVSNNAVTLIKINNSVELYSFNGLLAGKTYQDITKKGFRFAHHKWSNIVMPETSLPVLASTAVSIGTNIYLIGGYTVNAKGEEKSVPQIFVLDAIKQEWSVATTMPIPVDDTVALVYANRYIYLISGWHDVDNVSQVQVYDSQDNAWFNATPYPAPAVFGQAGGIVNNTMVVCDGVKVVATETSREFVPSPVCAKGVINSNKPHEIEWELMPHHSGTAFYRMAATGVENSHKIVFAGGSDNPYNYNGIGYDGIPSNASNQLFSFNLKTNKWQQYSNMSEKNMDHRAMLSDGEWFYIVGGMDSSQNVMNHVLTFKIPNE